MTNTENQARYPEGWSTVHFGLSPRVLVGPEWIEMRDQMRTVGWKTFLDGDGWQAWGQAPGTEDNIARTLHVQVAAPTHFEAAKVVNFLRRSLLPFVTSPDAEDGKSRYTVAVTTSEDWKVVLYTELFG